MARTVLVITSIADDQHPVLNQYALEANRNQIPFIVIGDTKSPDKFNLPGCDFYSIERQASLNYALGKSLPTRHYARKNIGYLVAIKSGADIILETDDDNIPFNEFWASRSIKKVARNIVDAGWVNVYRYFHDSHIWPRGFALEHIQDTNPALGAQSEVCCPIQQGLADDNPDVDAIYRLTLTLPVVFRKNDDVSLTGKSVCPFNSQNTTWFREAFPLLYLPSYCSFRMTDIWRSFVAQRIAQECDWSILFHKSTVRQERNDHNLMKDFDDEVIGYQNNSAIVRALSNLQLQHGVENIGPNLISCYEVLIKLDCVGSQEIPLIMAWLSDLGCPNNT